MQNITKLLSDKKTVLILAVFVFLGIVYSFFQTNVALLNERISTLQGTELITAQAGKKRIEVGGIDLDGPRRCQFASSSAFIYNQQVFLVNKSASSEAYLLYRGGCLYQWEKSSHLGRQTCGLDKYLSMLGNIQTLGINPQSLLENDTARTLLKKYNLPSNVIQGLSSCQKTDQDSLPSFEIPKTVQFSN